MKSDSLAIVVIGRNEGARLEQCLRSLPNIYPIVYVDSGSTDGSADLSRKFKVLTIELDGSEGFTAARARNAGVAALTDLGMLTEFVQFVDGDCELRVDWLTTALAALRAEPSLAGVFGRRRERFPNRSFYNLLCDDEWGVTPGLVASCGGDVLFRTEALRQVGGYSDDLIAGEEPDLCLRLSRLGWHFRCIGSEMTLHDANIISFKEWWLRMRRSGFAYAAHVMRHGSASLPAWRRQILSILFWGFLWPITGLSICILCLFISIKSSFAFLVFWFIAYLILIIRISSRKYGANGTLDFAIRYAFMITIAKFAQIGGVIRFFWKNFLKKSHSIIEYKRYR